MIILDANILLYAYQPDAAQHQSARTWLERIFSAAEPVRLPWSTVLAFVRIGTNRRVFESPLAIEEAEEIVSEWLGLPNVAVLEPGERYWEILRTLLIAGQVAGPLVSDAALAALAIEHGATLYTTDRDFARFSGLNWENPLA